MIRGHHKTFCERGTFDNQDSGFIKPKLIKWERALYRTLNKLQYQENWWPKEREN